MSKDSLNILTKKPTTYKLYSFDVETIGDDNKFYLGGLFDGETYYKFFRKEDMINFINEIHQSNRKNHHNRNVYFVATNLEFDFSALYGDTDEFKNFNIIISGSNIISAIYKTKEAKITFIDTLNYIKASVKKLGDLIGIPKLTSPKCMSRKPVNEEELTELTNYNKRDCEITYEWTKRFQDELNKDDTDLKVTIASISMNHYRRKYLPFAIHRKPDFKDEEFKSYYGGRTEIFARGTVKNVKLYDVNSLYPSCMINEYPLPISIKKADKYTPDLLEFEGFSDVLIQSPNNYYGLLPVNNGKLIFPNGLIKGVFTHVELRKALENNYKIIDCYSCYYYKKNFYPFKDFVKDIYDKRLKANNELEKQKYKSYLNNLYGKFAQKKCETMSFNISIEDIEKDENIYMNDNLTLGYKMLKQECKSPHVIPILSSYTTAYARVKMFDYLEKYEAYYTDTDSLITKKEIPYSNKLGEMKLEKEINTALLIKPKLYFYDGIIKSKGMKIKDYSELLEVINGKKTEMLKFSKIRESIRQNIGFNTSSNLLKSCDVNDNKRIWKNPFLVESFDVDSKPIIL